ncbi:translation initiation factor Eif4e [Umbelopsis sp. PMI_123]|nr:translation initiation factor Eif4e [Umbelopsis sp. PMI_123]
MSAVETAPSVDSTTPAAVESTPVSDVNATQSTETKSSEDDQPITIFHDRMNYNVKHPLHNEWTLWFDNPGKKANVQSWSQNLKEIVTFKTIEDFWAVFNNIVKVSRLDISSNYHLFKKGVRPEWEDPANEHGGKFSVQFPKNRTGEAINDLWLYTLLACIGEQLPNEAEVTGAVVSVRKVFFRISLWTKTSDNREVLDGIGKKLKETLNIPNMPLEFTPHSDAATKGPSENNGRFTI